MGDPVTAAVVAGGAMAGQAYLGGRQARNQEKMQAAQQAAYEEYMKQQAAAQAQESTEEPQN